MKTRAFKVLVVISWLVLTGWFVRYEAFPGFFTNTIEGYRDVLSEGKLFVESWMKVVHQGEPIGYTHSQIEVLDDDPLEHYRLSSRTVLQLNIMGEPQEINVFSSASLDVLYKLQRFNFALSSRRYVMRIEGERKDGINFIVHVKSDAGTQVARIEIPDDVIVYSPMTEMAMAQLKPGAHMRVRTFEPTSMSVADIMVRALRNESLSVTGQVTRTTVLAVEFQGMEMLSWIDEDGRVVRQETPFGWTMEACTADEALAIKFDASKSGDALIAMAVPCHGGITDPRGAKALRVRISDGSTQTLVVASNRQRIEDNTDRSKPVVLLLRGAIPTNATAPLVLTDELKRYLSSTPFVQADDPAIVKQARRLTEDRTNNFDKALALFDWVYLNVEKRPTVSLPSAVDVLNRMEGDCNEHTYLYTALARAVGIPTQIRVGLLFKDGVFYYHAWPSVFVGDWMEMDPTLGQQQVDATHIALLEGELESQMKLLQVFGRMTVDVLEEVDK